MTAVTRDSAYERLKTLACRMEKAGISVDEVQSMFAAIALDIALFTQGPNSACKWLRDLADAIESDGSAFTGGSA